MIDCGSGQPRVFLHGLRQPEVGDLGLAFGGHEDVRRLDVAVDDPEPVRVRRCPRQTLDQPRCRTRGPRGSVKPRRQAPSFDEFQLDVRLPGPLACRIDLHNVGVLQPRHRLGLAQQSLEGVVAGVFSRQDHLQSHQTIEPDLTGLIDHPHSTSAQLAEDLISGNLRLWFRANGDVRCRW